MSNISKPERVTQNRIGDGGEDAGTSYRKDQAGVN
jgi:hypothetical protein